MAEKIVVYPDYLALHLGKALLDQAQQVPHEALGGPARGDGKGGGSGRILHEVHGPEQVAFQGAEHTHAVF